MKCKFNIKLTIEGINISVRIGSVESEEIKSVLISWADIFEFLSRIDLFLTFIKSNFLH